MYTISLGSTRFFKVARARCREGLAVVKVFVIHDPSLPLSKYKDDLEGMVSCYWTIMYAYTHTHTLIRWMIIDSWYYMKYLVMACFFKLYLRNKRKVTRCIQLSSIWEVFGKCSELWRVSVSVIPATYDWSTIL